MPQLSPPWELLFVSPLFDPLKVVEVVVISEVRLVPLSSGPLEVVQVVPVPLLSPPCEVVPVSLLSEPLEAVPVPLLSLTHDVVPVSLLSETLEVVPVPSEVVLEPLMLVLVLVRLAAPLVVDMLVEGRTNLLSRMQGLCESSSLGFRLDTQLR